MGRLTMDTEARDLLLSWIREYMPLCQDNLAWRQLARDVTDRTQPLLMSYADLIGLELQVQGMWQNNFDGATSDQKDRTARHLSESLRYAVSRGVIITQMPKRGNAAPAEDNPTRNALIAAVNDYEKHCNTRTAWNYAGWHQVAHDLAEHVPLVMRHADVSALDMHMKQTLDDFFDRGNAPAQDSVKRLRHCFSQALEEGIIVTQGNGPGRATTSTIAA